MFGARELQAGQFFSDLSGGHGFHDRLGISGQRLLRGWRGGRRGDSCGMVRDGSGGARGLPDLVGVDLSLLQAGEIVSDGFFGVQAEMLGVGTDESAIEDATGKAVEVLLFDGLKHARADFGDVRNVIEREAFGFARLAEFVAELAHGLPGRGSGSPLDDASMIGHAGSAC